MPAVSEKQRRAMFAAAEGHSTLGIPKSVGEEFVESDARADAAQELCAGILLRAKGAFLLLKHAKDGVWVQPGGHVEGGETPLEAAKREFKEETGAEVAGEPLRFRRDASGGVDFTTFLLDMQDQFEPQISDESDAFVWAMPDALPENTHPEVAKSIALALGTELDLARAIQSQQVDSPQRFGNVWLFDVRVTGTGTSYRTQVDEYVYRPPEDFLTDDFLERCNGLPVIFGHPKDTTLNTDEYRQRAVGTIVLPYIKGDEVWGIAKIYDEDAATLMRTTHASTSPAVVFKESDDTTRVDAGNGETILIEGKPSYLDHLAICEEGVWDKGGEPSGIRSTEEEPAMADEATVPAYVDAIHERLDGIVSRLDALNKGEIESPKEEEHAAGEELAQAREEIKEERADAEEGKKEEVKADPKEERKDADEEGEDKKADAARADKGRWTPEGFTEGGKFHPIRNSSGYSGKRAGDSQIADAQARENTALKAQIKAMEDRMNRAFRPLSASDRDELARVQARGDNLAQMFGDSVNPPLAGESVIEYRKRLASKFQRHSDSTKGIKLDALDESSFGIIEERIYADAQKAAHNPDAPAEGRLVAIKSQDGAGRTITKYHGDPKAWLKPFMAKGMSIRFADSATRRGA